MKIVMTLREFADKFGMSDKACNIIGISPWSLNEGANPDDVIYINDEQAKALGIIMDNVVSESESFEDFKDLVNEAEENSQIAYCDISSKADTLEKTKFVITWLENQIEYFTVHLTGMKKEVKEEEDGVIQTKFDKEFHSAFYDE